MPNSEDDGPAESPTVLIAGVGNVLRQDDGFGIEVARRLLERGSLPDGVTVVETGIGGIHLVQELMTGYDVLMLIDAVERGGEPGHIYLLEVEIDDIRTLPPEEMRDFLADMHYTNPDRALMLAKALDALPPRVFILGCEAADHDDFAMGLSESVREALPDAVDRIETWTKQLHGEIDANARSGTQNAP